MRSDAAGQGNRIVLWSEAGEFDSRGEIVMNRYAACLLAALLGFGAPGAHAAICRVASDGVASNDGSDWTLATTLQDALANGNGKDCDEIWVKAGVYKPTTGTNRSISFAINRPLFLYGGFAGTEASLAERVSSATNPSILSGDIDNNDIDTDGNQIAEDFSETVGNNSIHVVVIGGVGTEGNGVYLPDDTVVDGFTITAGNSTGDELGLGAGLFCNGGGNGKECSPSLSRLRFSGNTTGTGASLPSGGGLAAFASSDGISSPVLNRVHFGGNGSAIGGGMAALVFNGGTSAPLVTQSSFVGNRASQFGGGFASFCTDGTACSAQLTHVTFSANQAPSGGAFVNAESQATLTHVTFSGNAATGGASFPFSGGAIFSFDSDSDANSTSLTLQNSLLWGNTEPPPTPPFPSSAQIVTFGSTLSFVGSLMQPGGCFMFNGAAPLPCPAAGHIGTDPELQSLIDNGAGTFSHTPGEDGGAIDAGDAGVCAALEPSVDQRGIVRPQGGGCDIGAVELRRVICRVAADGVAANDGSSWAQATTLQDALANGNGKLCDEIWVKGGLYTPTESADRSISFAIDRPVDLYGGFAGTEVSRASRALDSANRSILSGDIDGNDIDTDGNRIAETAADIVGGNSFHVLVIGGRNLGGGSGSYDPETNTIDGFIVTAGQADGASPDDAGGGLFCNGAGSGRICSPELNRVSFSGNRAMLGGAIFNNGSGGVSSPVLTQSTLSGNAAQSGGAIHNNGVNGISSPILTHVTLGANHASDSGGAIYSVGSAGASDAALENSILWDNSAANAGSAIVNLDASSVVVGSLMPADGCFADGAGTCPASGFISIDPDLGPLADNGGGMPTHLPGAAGGAVDAGDAGVCDALDPAVDQRGVVRPQLSGCDIGAVELRAGSFSLLVFVLGPGSVSEASALARIDDCTSSGGLCGHETSLESSITLVAEPAAGFMGWIGECSGSANTSTVVLDSFRVCIAQFSRTQTIDFGPQATPLGFATGRDLALDPIAVASSGLPVSHASTTPSVCSISGTTVSMLSPGLCTIEANQPGGMNHDAAPPVSQSIEFVLRTVSGNVAGSGGSVTPTSQQVEDGATATLTIVPEDGFVIDTVTGCDGLLDGTTYTTAAVTSDCVVTASFATDPAVGGLSVWIGNGRDALDPGDQPVWQVVVSNSSDVAANGANLSLPLVPALSDAIWTCVAGNGGSCTPSEGSDAVSIGLDLPASSQADITFSATVGAFTGSLDVTATITPPAGYADNDANDNTDIDSDVRRTILRDGFESP